MIDRTAPLQDQTAILVWHAAEWHRHHDSGTNVGLVSKPDSTVAGSGFVAAAAGSDLEASSPV